MPGRRGLLIAAVALWAVSGPALSSAASPAVPQAPAPAAPAEPTPRISPEATPEQDRAIERRLRQIFAELEGVQGVGISVRGGVVVLTGEVLSQTAREQAVKLARQVEGAVEVRDKTTLVRDVRRQIAPAVERLQGLASDVLGYLPLLAFALGVFLVFWLLATLLGRWQGLYRRFTANEFLAGFLRQMTKLVVLAVGLVLAFDLLDAAALMGTVLGAAGLMGLALGFALRDTVENYIAGILLSMKQPFVHDDLVEIEGHEGQVLRLTSRATIVMTLDGNHVRIPNARVFNGVVVNYTRNPERRFSFDVGVSVETSLAEAQHLAARTLHEMEGVLDEPPPHVDVHALGDFNVTLRVFGWVDQRRFEFLKVRSESIRLVKETFDAAGIVMPAPVYDVRTQEAPPAEARAATGPRRAIDIQRRTDLQREIDEDRRASAEPDLLRSAGPLE